MGLFKLVVLVVSLSGDGAVNQLAGLVELVCSDINYLRFDSEFNESCSLYFSRILHLKQI